MALIHIQVVVHIQAALIYAVVMYHIAKFAVIPVRSALVQIGFTQACADVWKRCALFWCCLFQSPAGAFGEAIQQQLDDFRVEQCERCIRLFAHLLGVAMIPVVASAQSRVASTEDIFFLCFLGSVYIAQLWVAVGGVRLTKRRIDILYTSFVLVSGLYLAMMEDDPRFFKLLGAGALMKLAMGILYLDYVKAVPLNVCASIVSVWRYPYNCSILQNNDRYGIVSFAIPEFFVCFGVSLGCYIVQKWLESWFRLQMSAQSQKRATHRLAVYQCDAVVGLTPDLHVSGEAPQLAHMLFMPGAPNHLEGRPFKAYLATDSDRDRFETFLEQSIASNAKDGLPALLHVDLRDSTSRVFPVDMIHSWFVDDRNRIGHLIGITESRIEAEVQEGGPDGEQERAELAAIPPSEVRALAAAVDPTLIGRQSHQAAESVTSAPAAPGNTRLCENTGDMPPLMPLVPEHRTSAPISIVVDAFTYEIVGCTAGFSTMVGPLLVATNMQDVILNFVELLAWMQHWVNVFLETGQSGEPLRIRLSQQSRNRRRRIRYRAEACLRSVRISVNTSDMGVQLNDPCSDEERDIMCAIEIRKVEIEWPDQNNQNATVAHESMPTPAYISL